MKKVMICGFLFVLMTTATFAAPTLSGPTGLIKAPSADSLSAGTFDLALHNYAGRNTLAFNVGLAPSLEAGIAATSGGNNNSTSTHGFVKFTIVPEKSNQMGVAIGARAYSKSTSLFVVGSKYLPEIGFRGHIGMNTGGSNNFFLGASKSLPTRQSYPKMIAMGEIYGGSLNLGLRMLLTKEVNLDLAILDLDQAMIGLGFNSRF